VKNIYFVRSKKRAKRLWSQDPKQSNADNLNSIILIHEASTHFRNKRKEYPKTKIDKLETNSKIKKT
jgi:hypothetical protein